jgi:hypothetical protein
VPNQSTGNTFAPPSVAEATTLGVCTSVKPSPSSVERKPCTEAAATWARSPAGMPQRQRPRGRAGWAAGRGSRRAAARTVARLAGSASTAISGSWISSPPGAWSLRRTTAHPHHRLGRQRLGSGADRALVAHHHLDDPVAVAQQQEAHVRQVPLVVHPPREHHPLVDVPASSSVVIRGILHLHPERSIPDVWARGSSRCHHTSPPTGRRPRCMGGRLEGRHSPSAPPLDRLGRRRPVRQRVTRRSPPRGARRRRPRPAPTTHRGRRRGGVAHRSRTPRPGRRPGNLGPRRG